MVSFYLATKTLPSFKQHTTVTAEMLLTPLLWARHELLNLWADLEGNSSCLWDHGGVSPLDPLLRPWNWLLLCGQSHRCCVVCKLRQVLVHQAIVGNRCVYLQVDDHVHGTLSKSWKKILTCGPIGSKMPERTNKTVWLFVTTIKASPNNCFFLAAFPHSARYSGTLCCSVRELKMWHFCPKVNPSHAFPKWKK